MFVYVIKCLLNHIDNIDKNIRSRHKSPCIAPLECHRAQCGPNLSMLAVAETMSSNKQVSLVVRVGQVYNTKQIYNQNKTQENRLATALEEASLVGRRDVLVLSTGSILVILPSFGQKQNNKESNTRKKDSANKKTTAKQKTTHIFEKTNKTKAEKKQTPTKNTKATKAKKGTNTFEKQKPTKSQKQQDRKSVV